MWGQTPKALLYASRDSHSKHSRHPWAASMQAQIPHNAAGKGILSRDGASHLFPSPPRGSPSHPWQGMLIMCKELIASTLP